MPPIIWSEDLTDTELQLWCAEKIENLEKHGSDLVQEEVAGAKSDMRTLSKQKRALINSAQNKQVVNTVKELYREKFFALSQHIGDIAYHQKRMDRKAKQNNSWDR